MLLAITLYAFVVAYSSAKPAFYHQVGYTLYENAYNGNGTLQALREPLGGEPNDGCQDKDPLCRHEANEQNCKDVASVMEKCPRSCGLCGLDCKSVEPAKRVDCGKTTFIDCNYAKCCWHGEAKDIKCHKPYFVPPPINDSSNKRTVVHM